MSNGVARVRRIAVLLAALTLASAAGPSPAAGAVSSSMSRPVMPTSRVPAAT